MPLALFDLDNTLLIGDSDYLWGQFLVEKKLVDGAHYEERNREFFQDYKLGKLDIHAYLSFQLGILAQHEMENLHLWRRTFVHEKILPIISNKAKELLQWHRQRQDTLVIITATNRFVTTPIAEVLGVAHLLATDLEEVDGRFTGRPAGIPCFQDGKVHRLMQWIKNNENSLENSWFYSDSHNDLPLLTQVKNPVAVDPDDTLRQVAEEKGWKVISLRP